MGVDNISLIGRHGNLNRIRLRLHDIIMLQITHDKGLMRGNHVVEICINPDILRLDAQKDSDGRAGDQK